MLLFLFHVHCFHTVKSESGKEFLFEVLFLMQQQHHPIFMQINFIIKTSLSMTVFQQTGKNQDEHTLSTNKPFNDAPLEPIGPFLNVSSVFVWRECEEWHINKCLFPHLCIHLPSLQTELMEQERMEKGADERKVFLSRRR